MLRKLLHILALGLKELNSIRADPILLALTVYTFSYAVYAVAHDMSGLGSTRSVR